MYEQSSSTVLKSLNSFSTILQVVTVNCARIIHGNQVATNGVVHVIDRVISVVSQTIKDVIESNDDLTSLNVCYHTRGFVNKYDENSLEAFWTFEKKKLLSDLGKHVVCNVFYRQLLWAQVSWVNWQSPDTTHFLLQPMRPLKI